MSAASSASVMHPTRFAKSVVMLEAPNAGAFAYVKAIASEQKQYLETVVCSITDRQAILDGFAGTKYPKWVNAIVQRAEQGQDCVLVLNDLDKTPVELQRGMLDLVLYGRIGDCVLPDNVRIVAIANPPEFGGTPLPQILFEQEMVVEWQPNMDTLTDDLMAATKARYQDMGEEELLLALGYAAYVSGLMLGGAGEAVEFGPLGSIAGASAAVDILMISHDDGDEHHWSTLYREQLLSARLGRSEARRIKNYFEDDIMVNPYEAIRHPEQCPMPETPEAQAQVAKAVALVVAEIAEPEAVLGGLIFMDRLAKECGEDTAKVGVDTMTEALQHRAVAQDDPKLLMTYFARHSAEIKRLVESHGSLESDAHLLAVPTR